MSQRTVPKRTCFVSVDKLFRQRRQKGWSQETLAEKAGCDKKTIENAEAGRPILLRTLGEIATALAVDPKELIRMEAVGVGQVESRLPKRGALERAITAWSTIDFRKLFGFLANYYQSKGVPVFSYWSLNAARAAVPLFVRPSWLNLTEDSLRMSLTAVERPVILTKPQREFLELYPKVRKKIGLAPIWNNPLFRLVELQSADPQLVLHFEEGRFLDTVPCQYILEHETRLALAKAKDSAVRPRDLPIRESLASTSEAIERFCQRQVVRVGVSNLLLFCCGEKAYRPR